MPSSSRFEIGEGTTTMMNPSQHSHATENHHPHLHQHRHHQAFHHETADSAAAVDALDAGSSHNHNSRGSNNIKRLCRFPGCIRVIKSQGHCQRHGAKAKRCRVEGCDKQAQGTHDGCCKRHWKSINFPGEETNADDQPPPPQGDSAYDSIIPASIAFRPGPARIRQGPPQQNPTFASDIWDSSNDDFQGNGAPGAAAIGGADPMDPPRAPPGSTIMPLITFLQHESHREAGWHRNGERRARGMFPVSNLAQQLEPWERQLALVEILLLSGGTPYANFKDLAHAWGRDKGFHTVLINSICERRGEVERKRRSDAGKTLSEQERLSFREKLRQKRHRRGSDDDADDDGSGETEDQKYEAAPSDRLDNRHLGGFGAVAM